MILHFSTYIGNIQEGLTKDKEETNYVVAMPLQYFEVAGINIVNTY